MQIQISQPQKIIQHQHLEKRNRTKQTHMEVEGQSNRPHDRLENINKGNIIYQYNKNLQPL